jgi:hypothetical protein
MALTKITSSIIAAGAIDATALADNSITIGHLNCSDGSSGQALTTDGSGTLSFSDVTPDQSFIIVGRSSNVTMTLTSATLTVAARSGNLSIGV